MNIKEKAFARRKAGQIQPVPMPEWGEETIVHVRELSALERDDYEAEQVKRGKSGKALANFRARLVGLTTCDDAGQRIFADSDLDALGELPASEVRKLFDVAAKLNCLGAAEEAELEKKS